MLFEFIEIAPNVFSFEPGILKVSFSIYLNIHLILKQNQINQITGMNYDKSLIRKMINLVESFIISNCSFPAMRTIETSYNIQNTNNSNNTLEDEYRSINDFNNLLDMIMFSDFDYNNYSIDFFC